MVRDMKEIGKMISSMAKARKLGLMALSMKANISRERNMDSVYTVGMTGLDMKVNGMKTRLEVWVLILG
jgi:hypothetical protein